MCVCVCVNIYIVYILLLLLLCVHDLLTTATTRNLERLFLHYMCLRYTTCVYVTLHVSTLHYMCLRYTTCVYVVLTKKLTPEFSEENKCSSFRYN